MPRKLAALGATALVMAWMLAGATAWAILPTDLLGLPSPTEVVRVIDTLTRKDSDTDVQVKLGKAVGQGKLLVSQMHVEVVMDRSSRNWRGRVAVHMTVPTDISYSVNLTTIRTEHIRIDPKQRLLIVTMPPPQVEAVTPVLPDLKSENTFKHCRFRRFDADACRDLQNSMLKEDYQDRARKEGESRLPEVRNQARAAVGELLKTLLRTNCPDIQVRVE
jgi:hypothetical protein